MSRGAATRSGGRRANERATIAFLLVAPSRGCGGGGKRPAFLRRLPPRRSRAAATSAPSDAALRFIGGLPQPDTANAASVPATGRRAGGRAQRSRSARRPVARARHSAISTRGRGQTVAVARVPSCASDFRKCETWQTAASDLCVHG
jgi:hypothetical protein